MALLDRHLSNSLTPQLCLFSTLHASDLLRALPPLQAALLAALPHRELLLPPNSVSKPPASLFPPRAVAAPAGVGLGPPLPVGYCLHLRKLPLNRLWPKSPDRPSAPPLSSCFEPPFPGSITYILQGTSHRCDFSQAFSFAVEASALLLQVASMVTSATPTRCCYRRTSRQFRVT